MDGRRARERELLVAQRLLEEANANLRRLACRDGLTGIANRRHFDDTLEQVWWRAARLQQPLSLILVDLDFFKRYNDTFLHQAGDECLRSVVNALRRSLYRAADFLAGYGGEEFGVILSNTDGPGAACVAERLRPTIRDLNLPHPSSPVGQRVTISTGVACAAPQPGCHPQELLSAADAALYEAKRRGRDRVVVDSTALVRRRLQDP